MLLAVMACGCGVQGPQEASVSVGPEVTVVDGGFKADANVTIITNGGHRFAVVIKNHGVSICEVTDQSLIIQK